jgi:8-oxo-dGTP diphosphatase
MNSDEVRYCLHCATELIEAERFGKLRKVCPTCGWIYFADPKVAAAVLVERENKVLLVRRAFDPGKGAWTLPAGFVDAGEDPAVAAARECLEETGLSIAITGLLTVLSGQEHPRGAHIIIFYQGTVVSGKLSPNDDADQVGFFPRNNLPPLAFSTTQKVLDLV